MPNEKGRIGLTKQTPQQVQPFYAKKLEEGISPTTVAHAHAVLYRALDADMGFTFIPPANLRQRLAWAHMLTRIYCGEVAAK